MKGYVCSENCPASALGGTVLALVLSTSYHRCVLLPPGPPTKHEEEAGTCTEYIQSNNVSDQHQRWHAEQIAYLQTGDDLAFFTLHHFEHRRMHPMEGNLGGRVVFLHENCYRNALTETVLNTSAVDSKQVLGRLDSYYEKRFGPTWLELRVIGPELHVYAMRYVPPSQYQPYHYTLLRSGSHRRSVMTKVYHDTAQHRADLQAYLDTVTQSNYNMTTSLSPDQQTLRVRTQWRSHSDDICIYEHSYAVSVTGTYDIVVHFHNTDYEHISNDGPRRGLRRSQLSLIWASYNRSLIRTSNTWPPSEEDENAFLPTPAPPTNGSSTEQPSFFASSDFSDHPLDSSPRFRRSVVLLSAVRKEDASSIILIPLIKRVKQLGRWMHVSYLQNVHLSHALSSTVWWKRDAALQNYAWALPALALCRLVKLTDYRFIPYAFDHTPRQMGSTDATQAEHHRSSERVDFVHPSGAMHASILPVKRLTDSVASFSFHHASCCLSGRRLAMVGDSQSRVLLSRFASIFSGNDVKFTKQKFKTSPYSGGAIQEWQCIALTVLVANLTNPAGQDDTRNVGGFIAGLPVSESTVSSDTSLGQSQFELCYYPSSFLEHTEVLAALDNTSHHFDVVILDTAHWPLAYGMDLPEYALHMRHLFEAVEETINLAHQPTQPVTRQTWQMFEALSSMLNSSFSPESLEAYSSILQNLSSSPSAGLANMRSQMLWWSTQSFPRNGRSNWNKPEEKRTQARLQLYREVVRAVTGLLAIDYVDITEDISVPFQDCASDVGHVDWPVVDEVFVQIYAAIQQKLDCHCQL